MAEKEKKLVKYKFGRKELNLSDYINNLGNNVLTFLNKLNWNSGQKEEFMNAYNQYMSGLQELLETDNGRFSADDFGNLTDSSGLLSSKDNDNIDPVGSEYYYNDKGERITTDDYNTLKSKKLKKFKTFDANLLVAAYFNEIGRMSKGIEPEKSEVKEKFDINKHGFLADWQRRNNPAGGEIDLTPYLNKDAYDATTKKRSRENRLNYLYKELESYLKNFNFDYDFSNSNYKSSENYKNKLQSLINNMKDGIWSEDDMIAANQAGISGDFYNAFFTEDENPNITQEQKDLAAIKEKELAEAKKREDALRNFIINLLSIYDQNRGNYYDESTASIVDIPTNVDWMNKDGSVSTEKFLDDKIFKDYHNIDVIEQEFLSDPYNPKWYNYRKVFLDQMIKDGTAQQVSEMPGFYYIPRATDRSTSTALVYNPSTRLMFNTFIGNTSVWDNIVSDYKKQLNWINPEDRYMRKEGGVLRYLYGGFMKSLMLERDQNLQERAKESNKTVEQLEASERYINSDNKSLTNPDAGFTSVEWARLAGSAADIASTLTAWAPGIGTATSLVTGLGSTGANLYADIMDDSVSAWGAAKNAFFNLGMDLAGLIPGGGAAGKFAKIGKNIVKIAPKFIAVLGTLGNIANAPEYIASWKKLNSDEKLNAQDWNNIMSSIQAVLGPSAAVGQYAKNKGYYGKNKIDAAKKVDAGVVNQDKVAVKMQDKNGKEQTVLFTGDDAVAIRKAQESGKLEDLKAATVDKFQDLDGWSLKETDFGFRRPQLSIDLTKMSPIGGKAVTPNDLISDVITRQGVDFARVRGFHDDVTSFYTPGRKFDDIDNAYVEAQLQPLISKSAAYDRILNRKKKAVADYDSKITTADTNLANAKASGSNKTSAELDNQLQQMRKDKANGVHAAKLNEILNSQSDLTLALKELASAERKIKRLEKMELAAKSETTRNAIRDQIKDAQVIRKAVASKIENTQKIIDDNTKWLADNDDAKLLALENEFNSIKALEDVSNNLKAEKAKWDKYTDTGKTKLREDFETNYPVDANGNITIKDPNTGREIVRNFNAILKKYNIKHKQGGVLNMTKVRSFGIGGSWRKNILDNLNAENANDWDSFHNMDDILNSIKNIDSSKLVSALNNLEFINADFSTKEVNKRGYGLWNRAFNNTGLNTFFGYNEDKADYLGPTTWNRNALVQKLKELKNIPTADGSINFNNGLWLINNLDGEDVLNPTVTKVKPVDNTEENTSGLSLTGFNVLSDILNNPTVTYALPRALYADKVNKKLTDMAVAGELAVLKNPFTFNRYISGDLNALNAGQKAQAELNSRASKFFTSDPSLLLAMLLDAAYKGLEFLNLGKMLDNAAVKQSSELAMQLSKENALNEHEVSEYNKLQLALLAANINKHKMAYENKKHTIYDTLWKLFEFEAKQKLDENKAYTDYYTQQDISNKVATELGILDASLDPEGVKLYLLVNMGSLNPSDITDLTKYLAFIQAYNRAKELENEMLRESRGIPKSKYYTARTYKKPNNLYTLTYAESGKNGTKLKISKLKARLKDVENFLKSIQKSLDRNEKRLDRLSKSMYRLSKK